MQKRWLIKNSNPQGQVILSNSLGIHPVIAQLLINRGISEPQHARDFLFGDLSSLSEPYLLKDMDVAVERIRRAQKDKERILIFGDYDVDGVTSSVVLKNVLEKLGIDLINYIPHRITEGYGLNHFIADFAKEKGVKLLIAVDCGTNAYEEIDKINAAGIDVIVIDHHEPSKGKLPKALAVINPKRRDCTYPFKNLASVGLVLKLCEALLGNLPEGILDLVAIGTISDVAELTGENRILVKEGLKRLNHTPNKGLLALMQTAKLKAKKISPHMVGFILGPRINAAGRISSAQKALELLLSDDFPQALMLAQALEEENKLRQKTQNNILEEALSIVSREVNFKDHRIIVLSKEGWHKGVLGIVASRIADTYYRPAIVISLENGIGTGSARSIDSFHLFDALTNCESFLENYGGHSHAAGLTIRSENIDNFRDAINTYAKNTLTAEDLTPSVEIDCELVLSHIDEKLVNDMDAFEPCGEGNPAPLFCSRNLKVKAPPLVVGRDTIKFWVTDGSKTLAAVGFGMASYLEVVANAESVDLAYQLTVDDWNKEPTAVLKLKDIRGN